MKFIALFISYMNTPPEDGVGVFMDSCAELAGGSHTANSLHILPFSLLYLATRYRRFFAPTSNLCLVFFIR